jgi:acyl carrier protein
MTKDEALEWIADIFEEPVENIRPESSREDIEAWDSLGVLNLIAYLDEDLDIQMSDEEVQQIRGVQDILAVLERNGALNGS